jgi:hypothetical protein
VSLVNLQSSTTVDCWSDDPTIIARLFNLLPFGQIILQEEYEDFIENTLPRISGAAQDQLLYWHLADPPTSQNYPIESTLLWNSDSYLWNQQFPSRETDITTHILNGERVCFLEQFRLDHINIRISFQEIRLITYGENQTRPVITEGRELTYKWINNVWETTLENPVPRLINPRIYHFPIEELDNDFEERGPTRIQVLTVEEQLLDESLPPSSLAIATPDSDIGWEEDTSQGNRTVCWCGKEVCDCGYRPNTPPTPPSVVLWAPGHSYLPARE